MARPIHLIPVLLTCSAAIASCTPQASTPDQVGRPGGATACLSHTPYIAAYTFKRADTCLNVFRKLNFASPQQLQAVNGPIWRFRCPGKNGDLVCYKP